MTFYDNVLTAFILIALVLIGYLKYTNQTVGDLIRDLRDALSDKSEEIVEGGLSK